MPVTSPHKQAPLAGAQEVLDEISHAHAPSKWLASKAAEKKAAQQLGTLGGGNHFLEVRRMCLCLHVRLPGAQACTFLSGVL